MRCFDDQMISDLLTLLTHFPSALIEHRRLQGSRAAPVVRPVANRSRLGSRVVQFQQRFRFRDGPSSKVSLSQGIIGLKEQ